LNVGVLVSAVEVPAWQWSLLESLIDSVDCRLTVCAVAGLKDDRPRNPWLTGALARLGDRVGAEVPDALSPRPLLGLTAACRSLDLVSLERRQRSVVAESILDRDLDVLIGLVPPELLQFPERLARLGFWYFEADGHGYAPADGSGIGLAQVLHRDRCLHGSLRIRLPDSSRDKVAYRTVSPVDARCLFTTRNAHLWKCSLFAARALRQCRESGQEDYLGSLPDAPPGRATGRYTALTMAFCSYIGWRIRQKLANRGTSERWVLLSGQSDWGPERFDVLEPPPGRFWADPHVTGVDGESHVFFEDASIDSGKGHIASVSRRADGTFTTAVPVLQRPYHLSYPFVFEWQDDLYMVPETAENRSIELYRCVRMPHEWEFVHTLVANVRAYDATLLEHAGRWWLFANIAEREGSSSWDELCIFHADSPISRDWRPHRANPVVSDVRRARPAGRFFLENDRLIRPSQDSSGRYGRALVFSEVKELTERSYREVEVRRIEPGWNRCIRAVHSYSRQGPIAFMDAVHCEKR
jgi:hypothetical protein